MCWFWSLCAEMRVFFLNVGFIQMWFMVDGSFLMDIFTKEIHFRKWNMIRDRSGFAECRRCFVLSGSTGSKRSEFTPINNRIIVHNNNKLEVLTCETPALKNCGFKISLFCHTITGPPRPAHSCQIPSGEEAQSGRSMSAKLRAAPRKTKSVLE